MSKLYPSQAVFSIKHNFEHGILIVTFEDKRKENFDKGQAELERRRQMLQEQMRQQEQARMEKERQEQEKILLD
jgi:hypothetical protein